MITLSNGERLEFLTGSGALGFDGRGWWWEYPLRWLGILNPHDFAIVVKTLTLKPRRGNLRWYAPWRCVRLIPGGTVNAVGLTNPGVDWWIRTCYPRMKRMRLQIVVSVFAENAAEAQAFAGKLKPLEIAAIELNASCPNVPHESAVAHVRALAEALAESGHPLIVKVGYDQPYTEIARAVEGVAEAIHAINAVPWRMVFPDKPSPLANLGGGGVSGEPIRPMVREAIRRLRETTHLPLIAGGGIYTLQDLEELWALGARAFSIGTLFLRAPWMPNRLVRQWRERHPTEYNGSGPHPAQYPPDAPAHTPHR
ncbi:MAG: HisA/HisF-related TIM barrel protein [Fimbriimonadales bacterium]|nr:HisA/HisF-related TIM barrel protein [Fimbriimonadales bacterium]GBC91206.1 Dihydroorotate dehydrogenase B (NAD(+)), catalytic subunit [bacterium HR14]GIV14078.1 MAG: dihydroorotate dehydrogenase [Fimbriimonadales bacterium]CUU09593.1 dihydroorotate dehydrogenase (NAD+) catalytic subunit [Armatimonadetes bacterium GBS]CUU35170.1 dihydroorotate dehydrogenase (NAD+) catalytic subunit [Armatimonadetes bacterium GXS]